MDLGTDFDILRLSPEHRADKFSLGAQELQPLKSFIQKNALDYQNANVAVTYVAVVPAAETGQAQRVVGFITLTCSEIDLGDSYPLEDCAHANRYSTMPALKIARLAVDKSYGKQGIGKCLMDLALAIAIDQVGPLVGCRFLVTDAKQGAVSFYKDRHGFTLLDTEDNRARNEPVMFVDLNKIAADETLADQEINPETVAVQSVQVAMEDAFQFENVKDIPQSPAA